MGKDYTEFDHSDDHNEVSNVICRGRDSIRFEQQNSALRALHIYWTYERSEEVIVKNQGIQEELGMQRNPSREKRKLPWLISMANAHRKAPTTERRV